MQLHDWKGGGRHWNPGGKSPFWGPRTMLFSLASLFIAITYKPILGLEYIHRLQRLFLCKGKRKKINPIISTTTRNITSMIRDIFLPKYLWNTYCPSTQPFQYLLQIGKGSWSQNTFSFHLEEQQIKANSFKIISFHCIKGSGLKTPCFQGFHSH